MVARLSCALALLGCAADEGPVYSGVPVQNGANAGGTAAAGAGGAGGNSLANNTAGVGGSTGGSGSAGARAGSGGSGGTNMSMTGASGMAGGDAGRGGSGGMMTTSTAGMGGSGPIDTNCPPAPAGVSMAAMTALAVINIARVPSGAGCATMIPEINMAATNHCNYYAMNKAGGASTSMCISNPHVEVMSCAGFTGANPGDRMLMAGFTSLASSEVMAFENNPERAIASWINSVWHRLPILDPWTTQLGYGAATGCDTIDFAPGMQAPNNTVVVYPYDGQTGLPTSFNGQYEGPMPPAPPTGWPSASPVTVYAKNMVVTEHLLTVDGSDTPIEHVWLTGMDPQYTQFLRNAVMMYGNAPLMANTKYRVRIKGTHTGGDLNLDWTFTTGAASRFP